MLMIHMAMLTMMTTIMVVTWMNGDGDRVVMPIHSCKSPSQPLSYPLSSAALMRGRWMGRGQHGVRGKLACSVGSCRGQRLERDCVAVFSYFSLSTPSQFSGLHPPPPLLLLHILVCLLSPAPHRCLHHRLRCCIGTSTPTVPCLDKEREWGVEEEETWRQEEEREEGERERD
jgi:hypothetical protein